MGWAGYDFTKEFDGFTKKTGIKVNFNEQPDNESIFAQSKLSLQTGTVDFCEPTVDRVQAFFENGIVQPWDMTKIDLDGYEPGLVTGQAGEMATIDGKRYFLPSVWGTEALVFNTEEAPMEYGTASLGDLFDPKYVGAVTVRPHSALAAMGRYLDSPGQAAASVHRVLQGHGRDEGRTGTSSWPRRSRPSPTSPSSGRARTRPRRRSAPMAACSASAGIRPASTCRARVCPSPTSPPRRVPSPGIRASCC